MNSHIILINGDSIDNVKNERIMRSVYQDATISIIESGEDALQYLIRKFGTAKPSIKTAVFLDERIVQVTGVDLLSQIKERNLKLPPEVKIYFLASSNSSEFEKQIKKHDNVRSVIALPLTAESLEEISF